MIAPLVLFLFSGVVVVWALYVPGAKDMLLVAGPSAIGSLYLFLQALVRRPARALRWIVVDGSNVMHWKEGEPDIGTVRDVVGRLAALGYTAGVVFDANAGYRLNGRYLNERALGRLLGLSEERITVVPKGTPADPAILAAARGLGARIVTNDRYRDWAETHPEVRAQGHLIRGGFRQGALWLDLDA
ncbi:hypothetical protein OU426_08795 [Frigidibacter sp. RF13]|uniref:NYN domain-containing protein n=1 Tax=Frigidibacter sp. RF13 TaxID=2997340 RepID=UPI00226FD5C2|nr:hypothetical protein [Frigidibacter sp. RF13]MCY1126950.1 hypothetical protein [Frigidibacter sp. RF13]